MYNKDIFGNQSVNQISCFNSLKIQIFFYSNNLYLSLSLFQLEITTNDKLHFNDKNKKNQTEKAFLL